MDHMLELHPKGHRMLQFYAEKDMNLKMKVSESPRHHLVAHQTTSFPRAQVLFEFTLFPAICC